jgi:hypothetical protein
LIRWPCCNNGDDWWRPKNYILLSPIYLLCQSCTYIQIVGLI